MRSFPEMYYNDPNRINNILWYIVHVYCIDECTFILIFQSKVFTVSEKKAFFNANKVI